MAFINFSRNPLTVLSVLGERRSRSALTVSERANLRASRTPVAVFSASLGAHGNR
ncbi:hypothetical protein VMT65_27665 [Nocardia sp. CDC153]|uniref:hypothetical protein n=1 Tax=unclassified Nocardia TaxID=2637762 RepID=UPI002DB6B25A|nr:MULTISPECIES: hypothetical protein [unclassified Nocardia]MEC3915801.1 hypothetical protein [Nocardia sp. CDC160]MEC3956844.1 hypothetical protein [Nocardia sp. CDC153]